MSNSGEPTTSQNCPQEGTLTHYLNKVLFDEHGRVFKYLEGRLSTLVDASFSDPQQRKAFKDMVREILKDVLYRHLDMSWLIQGVAKVLNEPGIPQRQGGTIFNLPPDSIKYKYTSELVK